MSMLTALANILRVIVEIREDEMTMINDDNDEIIK